MPQAIYSSFQIDIVNSGYRKQSGVRCPYKGVLGKTFVAAIMRGGAGAMAMLEEAIKEDGGGREVAEDEVGEPFRRIVQ